MVEKKLNEWMSVKDFAEICNISAAAVYKRISDKNNSLSKYCTVIDGKKFINSAALNDVQRVDHNQHTSQEALTDTDSRFTKFLEEQIAIKDKQLSEQAKLITELTAHLATMQKLIDQQQQLQGQTNTFLLQQTETPTESVDSVDVDTSDNHASVKPSEPFSEPIASSMNNDKPNYVGTPRRPHRVANNSVLNTKLDTAVNKVIHGLIRRVKQ